MAAPWDQITDDAYKSWLSNRQVTPEEYNTASLLDRSDLRTRFDQQQQSTALLPQAEQMAQIHANIQKREAEEGTVETSKTGTTEFNRITHRAGIKLSAPKWNDKPDSLEDLAMVSHVWLPGEEDSPENRRGYMAYLNNRNNITLPPRGKFFEASCESDLLSIAIEEFDIRVSGNVDVVLASDFHQGADTTRANMWAGIALKHSKNINHAEIQREVIMQHLAASYLNEDVGILTIMTDLCDRWHFFWFGKDSNEKLWLMKYEASKGEAKYLIQHMMDTNDQTPAPRNFLSRLSWNEVFPAGYASQPNQESKNDRTTGGARGEKDERAPHAGKKFGHQGAPQGGASRTGLSGNNNANEITHNPWTSWITTKPMKQDSGSFCEARFRE